MDQQENTDELIARSLADETSVPEKEAIRNWIAASESNRKQYSDSEAIYKAAGKKTTADVREVSDAWEKFSSKISGQPGKKPLRTRIVFSFYGKAAAAILLAVSGYFLYKSSERAEKEIILSPSSSAALTDTLPDGTFVSLDPKSTLTYSSSFNRKNRELKLNGKAYFHVQHNPLPFIVNAEHVFIKDLGTAFTITTYPGDSVVNVNVEEGQVVFYSAQDSGISLAKNETGIYNRTTALFRKKEDPGLNYNSGIVHTFTFESADLKWVADTLNKVYGSNLILSCKKLESLKLTATFTESSVEPIVETIAETFDLLVSRNGRTIVLDKKPCKN